MLEGQKFRPPTSISSLGYVIISMGEHFSNIPWGDANWPFNAAATPPRPCNEVGAFPYSLLRSFSGFDTLT